MSFHKVAPVKNNRKAAAPKPARKTQAKAQPKAKRATRRPVGHK
ncbi:hypothetical protein ACFV6E_10140 [Streptomyces sp. NPDC059785]